MLNTAELIVIFVVAFLVFGPEKLPEIARTLVKGLHSLKKSFDDVKAEVQTGLDEIKDTTGIKEVLNEGAALKKSLQDMTEQVKTDFKDAVDVSITEPPVIDTTKNIAEKVEGKEENNKVV
jgi:TatA/E family protein of Tat protein translocase